MNTDLELWHTDGIPDRPLDIDHTPDAIDRALEELTYRMALEQEEGAEHNADGWLAHVAGSSECLALGHREPEGGWDADTQTFDAGGIMVDLHPWGWDEFVMCRATVYAIACTTCQNECEFDRPPSVWTMPGVMAA